MLLPISNLKPHPKNMQIYGSENIDELVSKIQETKWIKPLTITQNNVIISGHRRYQACQRLGILEVPVDIRTFNNEFDELEALLLENLFREKTHFQKIKEGGAWEEIESEKARKRQAEFARGQQLKEVSDQVKENFPEPESKKDITVPQTPIPIQGQVRDIIAKKVGLGSGRDYDTGKKVVAAIESHEKEGNKQKAEILKIALEKSTSGAHKLVTEKVIDKITPEQAEDIKTGERSINDVVQEIKAHDRKETIHNETVALWNNRNLNPSIEVPKTEVHVDENKPVPVICDYPFCNNQFTISLGQKVEYYITNPNKGEIEFKHCSITCRNLHHQELSKKRKE